MSGAPGVDPRTGAGPAASFATPAYGTSDRGYDAPRDDRRRPDDRGPDGRRRKKKESWLEDLFDS